MQRIIVLRFDTASKPVNVNDEIGLDPYLSYTIREHLEDLASEEGLFVVAQSENNYLLSDDSVMVLEQVSERIDMTRLDEATQAMILQSAISKAPLRAPQSPWAA